MPDAEVVLLEGGVGVPAQRGGGLGDGAGIAFDLRLELDRGLIERALLERLFGRERRRQHPGKGQERGGNAGANEAKHG